MQSTLGLIVLSVLLSATSCQSTWRLGAEFGKDGFEIKVKRDGAGGNDTFEITGGPPGGSVQFYDKDGKPLGAPVTLNGEGKASGGLPDGATGGDSKPPEKKPRTDGGGPSNAGHGGIHPWMQVGRPDARWFEVNGFVLEDESWLDYRFRIFAPSREEALERGRLYALQTADAPLLAMPPAGGFSIERLVGAVVDLAGSGLPAQDPLVYAITEEALTTWEVFFGGELLSVTTQGQLPGGLWFASADVPTSLISIAPGATNSVTAVFETSSMPSFEDGEFSLTVVD